LNALTLYNQSTLRFPSWTSPQSFLGFRARRAFAILSAGRD
jgi:hypothetical protein